MPLSAFRLARLWLASGLMIVTTFTSVWAQETPVDPNYQDLILPKKTIEGFLPVTQLATPEIDYANCGPAPAAWHPPILFPNPEACCPTGVVGRDWLREHTTCRWFNYRQRMLEKDYAWRMQNGCQPTCCPPHSCWGHYCDECNGIGCKKRHNCWFGGKDCEPCNNGCVTNQGCQSCGNETSAVEGATEGVALAGVALAGVALASGEVAGTDASPSEALDSIPADGGVAPLQLEEGQANGIQLIGDEQLFGENGAMVETAGFCEVSDGCVQGNGSAYVTQGPYGYSDDCWEDCENDCDCPACCLKRRLDRSRDCFRKYLREDGPYGDYGRGAISRGRGGWRREIPVRGQYWLAYPHNPYHFDQRDGRIYGAQGYGHAVAVPLAPNVQHTFNYGWGVPSSRLTPVSRMPGAPGVANPAVPGAAGPGVLPPAFPNPLFSGLGR